MHSLTYILCWLLEPIHNIFLDDDKADDQGRVDLDEDVLTSLTTLNGVTVAIHVHSGLDDCGGDIVLEVTVMEGDIEQ